MASWAAPYDWKAGDLAATASASGTVDMNQQVYGNMEWLGSTHDHSGGTKGNNQVGPVIYIDHMDQNIPAQPGASTLRLFATGTTFGWHDGAAATYFAANSTHTH